MDAMNSTQEMTNKPTTSPLRLLILSPSIGNSQSSHPSPFPALLKRLTGTNPSPDVSSFAGYTSHPPLHLKTRYYNVNIGIWCDELPQEPSISSASSNPKRSDTEDSQQSTNLHLSHDRTSNTTDVESSYLTEWQSQMLSATAREVRDVVGGIIFTLPLTQPDQASVENTSKLAKVYGPYIEAVSSLRDAAESESGRSVASIILLQDCSATALNSTDSSGSELSQSLCEKLEDELMSTHDIIGWDFVFWKPNSTVSANASKAVDPTYKGDNKTSSGGGHDSEESTTDDKRNQFGELTGFPRVLEVLTSTDWTAAPSTDALEEDDDNDAEEQDFIGDDSDLPDFLSSSNKNTTNIPTIADIKPLIKVTNPTQTHDLDIHELTRGLLNTHSQHEFQREMLGLKMDMLDGKENNDNKSSVNPKLRNEMSPPSSLAGEFDVDDLRARTPVPKGMGGMGGDRDPSSGGMPGFATPTQLERRKLSRMAYSVSADDKDGKEGGSGLEIDEGDMSMLVNVDDDQDNDGTTILEEIEGKAGSHGTTAQPADQEAQVDQLSGLMERVVAIREAAAGMSPIEKQKFARREVNRIMKEMG